MSNAVAKKEETGLALAPPPAPTNIVASDVIVPRVLLMQSTSDFVHEGKAKAGDWVRSTNVEKLGSPEQMFDFVPLSEPTAAWITECRAVGVQRWTFKGFSPRNASNDGLPWKFNADRDGKPLAEGAQSGFEWRRVKSLSLYAILPQDIDSFQAELKKAEAGEIPDLSKSLTPVLMAFRSTSFPAGKDIITFFTQAQSFRMPASNFMLKLGCYFDKNDQGNFYVAKVDRTAPKPVKSEHKEHVAYWANIVSTTKLKVDETPEDAGTAAPDSTNF